MHGKILLPLSSMKEEYPKLYKEQAKIYDGRESLLRKKIPPLDCRWEDVLFFSTLNPTLIFAALELLGLLDDEVPIILRFPISALKDGEFCYYNEDDKQPFVKTTVARYKEEQNLPIETTKYFVSCVKKNEDPLIFSGVKHVLYKGEVDISKATVIRYDSLR